MVHIMGHIFLTVYVTVDASAVVCAALTDEDTLSLVKSLSLPRTMRRKRTKHEYGRPHSPEVMARWNTGCVLCRFQEGEEACFCNIRLLEQKVLAVVLRDKRQTAVTALFENQVADMPTASPLQSY